MEKCKENVAEIQQLKVDEGDNLSQNKTEGSSDYNE